MSDCKRHSPIEMSPEAFRTAGHELVDRLADFLKQMPDGKVTNGLEPDDVKSLIAAGSMPNEGRNPSEILSEAAQLCINSSLFNGHPRFLGFITSSAAPIGALADMLAASINPNVGGWVLSPMATEIELQTIRWCAELLDYPTDCGGLLVSGGNMANFVGFLCARKNKATWDVRKEGMGSPNAQKLRLYATRETHTWLDKATDLFGLGNEAIHWVATDTRLQMDTNDLKKAIAEDRAKGNIPFLIVGSAGTVSTGAIDPLVEMARIAKEEELWFHVDGAYGACAAMLPESSDDLKALSLADSIAFDPHKWLYAPLEAGCVLIRNPQHLTDAFSYRPPYYSIDYDRVNFYEIGPQNSRGFRALKVWLALQQAGRQGYESMLREDIRLAGLLYDLAKQTEELEAGTLGLSVTTFRYVPKGEVDADYLDQLNKAIMDSLNRQGDLFLSNAIMEGRFWLRACVVNFRTSEADIQMIPDLVCREGRSQHARLDVEKREGSRPR